MIAWATLIVYSIGSVVAMMTWNAFFKDDKLQDIDELTYQKLIDYADQLNEDVLAARGSKLVIDRHLRFMAIEIAQNFPNRARTIMPIDRLETDQDKAMNTDSRMIENKGYEDDVEERKVNQQDLKGFHIPPIKPNSQSSSLHFSEDSKEMSETPEKSLRLRNKRHKKTAVSPEEIYEEEDNYNSD